MASGPWDVDYIVSEGRAFFGPHKALAAPVLYGVRIALSRVSWLAFVLSLATLVVVAQSASKLGRGQFGPERRMKTAIACLFWYLSLEASMILVWHFQWWHAAALAGFSTLGALGTSILFVFRDELVGPMATTLLRRTGFLGPCVRVRLEPWPPAVVLTQCRVWQWLVDLGNERFFFGPLSMPVDALTADEIRIDLSPATCWRRRTIPLRVRNFVWTFHRASELEWSPSARQAAYTRWRRSTADWVCSLVEPPTAKPWAPAAWQWTFDLVAAHLDIYVDKLHLRVEDRVADVAFGIAIRTWHLTSERPGVASLGAPRRTFNMTSIMFYLDPTCKPRQPPGKSGGSSHSESSESSTSSNSDNNGNSTPGAVVWPQDGFLCAAKGCLVIDFPNIWQCLVNHEPMPYGQGKRLRVHGHFEGVLLVLHEAQLQHFLRSMLGCVGRYQYMKFKRWQRTLNNLNCRPLTVEGRAK